MRLTSMWLASLRGHPSPRGGGRALRGRVLASMRWRGAGLAHCTSNELVRTNPPRMGRPIIQREPVRRAILEALASGPVLARDALAEVMRRTGAARQTITRHGRELYDIESRREPGERVPTRWWRLRPEMMGIDSEMLTTAPDDPSAREVMITGPQARKSAKARRNGKRNTTGGRPSKCTGTDSPSLLDGHPRSSKPGGRQTALLAFGNQLASRRSRLRAITLTTASGYPSAAITQELAQRVSLWSGGLWLVPESPHRAGHIHHHGILTDVDPKTVFALWLRLADSAASPDYQVAKPVTDLAGWLDYCRSAPGFNLSLVVATGSLRDPWIWALGRAQHPLAPPSFSTADDAAPFDVVAQADLAALRRNVVALAR